MMLGSGTIYSRDKPVKPTVKGNISSPNMQNTLDKLVEKSNLIIFETESINWLWHPKIKITICPDKVAITRHGLFDSEESPLLIDSITGARVYQSLVFATLFIDTFGIEKKPEPVRYLRKSEARLARRYILALIECRKSNLDLTGYKLSELREKLKYLGMVHESSHSHNL